MLSRLRAGNSRSYHQGNYGFDAIFDVCTGIARSRLNRTHVLANGYVDLGTWSRFTPYVGAGVGVNVTYNKSQLNWYISNQKSL
jgi:opacity protein-like surface antigen